MGITISYFLFINIINQNLNTQPHLQQPTSCQLTPPKDIPTNSSVTDIDTIKKPTILNGDFEQGAQGWNYLYKTYKEENGNHYIVNNFNWLVKQDLNLQPNSTYKLNAQIKKGTAKGPARIVITFHDASGKKHENYNITYMPRSTEWEQIPTQPITIPKNATTTRIHLLTEDTKNYHCFDNISLNIQDTDVETNQNIVLNGDLEQGTQGL